jgi:cell division transport system permease protein
MASIMIQMVCFFLVGLAVLFSANVDSFLRSIESRNQIAVYVDPKLSEAEIARVRNAIGAIPEVESAGSYISPDEGLRNLINEMEGADGVFDNLSTDNPLPGLFQVTLNDLRYQRDVINIIKLIPSVENVRGSTSLADTLSKIRDVVTFTGIAIVVVLGVVSLVITVNTIKLTIINREKEIDIMSLVGATHSFIRLPFVIEGTYIGVIAALLAYGIIFGGYNYLLVNYGDLSDSFIKNIFNYLIPFSAVGWKMLTGFIASGVVLSGLVTSFFIGKYIKH